MKLQWGPEYGNAMVISDDGKASFMVDAVQFANGTQCIGASFEAGTTYVSMDELTGHVRFFVVPPGGHSPEELYNAKVRYVRADLLLDAFERMLDGQDV